MGAEIVERKDVKYNSKDKCEIIKFKHPALSGQLIVQPDPPSQSIEQEFETIAKHLSDDQPIFVYYPSSVFMNGEYCLLQYNRENDVLVNRGKFENKELVHHCFCKFI